MDPGAHVGLATLALLCYLLLFCSDHEVSLTALFFCAVCAWCAGQLAAAAAGAPGIPVAGASTVASAARTLCDSVLVLVLVLHRGAVTVSSAGPRGLFKGMTTATSGVIARFPLLLPVRNCIQYSVIVHPR